MATVEELNSQIDALEAQLNSQSSNLTGTARHDQEVANQGIRAQIDKLQYDLIGATTGTNPAPPGIAAPGVDPDPGTGPVVGGNPTPTDNNQPPPDNPPPAPVVPAAPAAVTPAPVPTGTNGAPQSQNLQSATAIVDAFLASIPGLAALDPQGVFSAWANTYMGTLAGQGLAPSDIVSTLEATMNNPGGQPEGANAGAQAVFDAVFPGYNAKIAAGSTNSDGSYTGISGYIQYSAQVQQFSQQAGLVPGTITQNDIGNLWGGNVSSSEVSQRITDATVTASSAPQPVQDYITQNYPGMAGTGALASYYLNPTNTLQAIQTLTNSAMVGGAAAASGFDKDLSTAQSQALGAFLANGTSGGSGSQVGGVNSVGFQQATNAFTSGLGSNQAGGQLGSASQMAAYETALPGQEQGNGTLTEGTLLSAIQGNAPALQQAAMAQQTRTASSKGGGGAATTSKGALGLGYADEG